MDRSSSVKNAPTERPALMGSFFQGFRSGAINSSLMMSIFSGVAWAVGTSGLGLLAIGPIGWGAAGVAVVATGLFSGVMSVKKTVEAAASAAPSHHRTGSPVNARSQSRQQAVDIAQDAPELRTDWAERTGRSSTTQSRVNDILSNGSLSDKDRASAILEAREAESGAAAARL